MKPTNKPDGARDAETCAQLLAAIIDTVTLGMMLSGVHPHDECRKIGIPAVIAAEGTAAMAAYLTTHGSTNGDIADALGVGCRTVSQYISDFRKGER